MDMWQTWKIGYFIPVPSTNSSYVVFSANGLLPSNSTISDLSSFSFCSSLLATCKQEISIKTSYWRNPNAFHYNSPMVYLPIPLQLFFQSAISLFCCKRSLQSSSLLRQLFEQSVRCMVSLRPFHLVGGVGMINFQYADSYQILSPMIVKTLKSKWLIKSYITFHNTLITQLLELLISFILY